MDNSEELQEMLKKAQADDAEAQFNLGVAYANGIGTDKNLDKAFYWYSKSAKQGYVDAQYNLALCYSNGEGTSQDFKQAVYWYTKAAMQNDKSAQENLGICYANGQGVEQNYCEAVKWFTKAAEQNHAAAQFYLAKCYYNGWGVEQDIDKAKQLLALSAEQGDEDAIEVLNNLSADNKKKNGKVGKIVFKIIAFPFWLLWQILKLLLRAIFGFFKMFISALGVVFGSNKFGEAFARGIKGEEEPLEEYTFVNSMGCTQTVYSSNERDFYDANGSYVGYSEDGGKTIIEK